MTEPQSYARLATAGPEGALLRRRELVWAPMLAALLASVAVLIGLQGVDLPAQLYRVDLFHRSGLTLWDSQWYGGHWTLNYSVVFPLVAGLIGVGLAEIAGAALAAWTFDRLVVAHFGRGARLGSLLFALGTLAQVAIGQLPFLLGESLALCALWLATRRRWAPAVALAFAAPLASPLAGAFLALALVAWLVSRWRRPHPGAVAMLAAAGVPSVALSVLFPGQGVMPFPAADFAWLILLFAGAAILIPARERTLRIGAALYVVAIALSFATSTPVGGNISRLGECVGAPLLICALWPQRRRLLALALAIPILTLQWGPALATFTTNPADPSRNVAYFQPLLGYLHRHATPYGRVEVVPTKLHWEAAYVAPHVPLARGWERQLDTADNPLFYAQAPLNAGEYSAWLLANGVRYVALPGVALDYAAKSEAALVRAGVPGLRPVWHDADWHVYAVTGSTGIVDGPARLVSIDGSHLVLRATGPGTIAVRERYSPGWRLTAGSGCVRPAADGWTAIDVAAAGTLALDLGLGTATQPGCPAAPAPN